MKDTISVVIPCYNCSDSIGAVLDALLDQTRPPEEIIVVNDASPDALEEALEPYRDRILYLRNARNIGLAKSYNVGLRQARGTYSMTLHSDCILDSTYLEELLRTIRSDDRIGAVAGSYRFSDFERMQKSDKIFSVVNALPIDDRSSVVASTEITFIEGKADLFRSDLLGKLGFFNEKLTLTAEDQDLSAKLRKEGYRLIQRLDCHFTVKYSFTQDSLQKVLRKQRTYARGQAYVLLTYGLHAVRSSTANRDFRVLHRLSQLAGACGLIGTLGLSLRFKRARPFFLGIVLWRFIYYFVLGRRLNPRERVLAGVLGPVCDLNYAAGMAEGAAKTLAHRERI